MNRFGLLAALVLLSPSAYAGNSISFSVGGHRVHVEASRYCRSTSCASVSVSGLYDSRRKRDRFEDDDQPAPAKAAPTVAPPVSNPPAPAIVTAPPPAVYRPAALAAQTVAAPPPPPAPPVQPIAIPLPPPPLPAPVMRPAEAARPATVAVPEIARVSHEVEEDLSDTPVGDWQTEGNVAVRIAKCGNALCGYVLNSSSNAKGEAVLINMKPKNPNNMMDTQWTGSVYSHESGDTFYGTVKMKGINALRVEACALGRFYCSGNKWSRITTDRADSLMTSRQVSGAPRS